MKNDLDKKIKGLLEDAAPADAGFELDRHAVWNRIESKQKAKVIPFSKWISHAAAVVIGILLCLPFLWHHEKEVIKTVTVTKTIPSIQTVSDTVFVVQNSVQSVARPNRLLSTPKKETASGNIAQSALQPDLQETTKEVLPAKEPIPALIATTKNIPRPAVLHLMDIENENTNTNKSDKKEFTLLKKITIGNGLDKQSETVSMIITKQIF